MRAEQHGPCALGRLQEPYRGLGDDAELTFRANDQPEEIIAGRIEMIAANLHDLAVHEHDAEPKHIVCGHAIFQAMGAACVHRDITAERASELARRIRGIKEAFCRDGIGDGDIGDAGFDAAARFVTSMASTLDMREMPSTIASSSGNAPPPSDVPAPRGTTLIVVSGSPSSHPIWSRR